MEECSALNAINAIPASSPSSISIRAMMTTNVNLEFKLNFSISDTMTLSIPLLLNEYKVSLFRKLEFNSLIPSWKESGTGKNYNILESIHNLTYPTLVRF